MAEWSKAPDSSSGPRERAWVLIPLLTKFNGVFFINLWPQFIHFNYILWESGYIYKETEFKWFILPKKFFYGKISSF
uniref:Uncharacterized protein n=1 Tax=Nelumbo nucifera TaxID=4432 RepID=A0A822ZF95_NELNU|nr:TPA_asm: hypothetical protein HUJ06_001463 [Nelumbo nucifera]